MSNSAWWRRRGKRRWAHRLIKWQWGTDHRAHRRTSRPHMSRQEAEQWVAAGRPYD